MRKVLNETQLSVSAQSAMASFHSDYVAEVEAAMKANAIVVVGMKQNPVVGKARKFLDTKGLPYKYIEHGSYFSMWKPRLAIKLWSGWPTFPMIFMDGKLIGGCKELVAHLDGAKN